ADLDSDPDVDAVSDADSAPDSDADPDTVSDADAEAGAESGSEVEAGSEVSDGDTSPPAFGGVVSAEALGMSEARLLWAAAADDVSPVDAIVYEVCVSVVRVGRGGCQPWVIGDETGPGFVEHVVTGLLPNTRYFFVVRARDEAGNVDLNLVEASALTPGDQAAKAVTVGGGHACALLAGGTVRCWGGNDFGQLGDGTNASRDVAAPVVGLELVKVISAGAHHTCAAIADGTVRCWGRNDRGQLGDGTTEDSALPMVVSGLGFVKALSAGDSHTCAILGDGTMRCWGANDRGQLGDGTFEDSLMPVEVSGAAFVKDLACGNEHTCAVAADGLVACWGRGDSGQLGHGDSEDKNSWTEVEALQLVTNVAAGSAHSCARIGDGTVACWGANDEGQLGSGALGSVPLPVLAPGVEHVSQIDAGGAHTCGRIGDGTVRCWGGGSSEPTAVVGLSLAAAVESGSSTSCARTGHGRVECWSLDTDGDSDQAAHEIEGLVGTAGVIDITSGASFYCALISDGTLRCWGRNHWHLLGGPPPPSGKYPLFDTIPVAIADISSAISVVGTYGTAVAVEADGGLRSFGSNVAGSLGGGPGALPSGPPYTPIHVLGVDFGVFVGEGASAAAGPCVGRSDGTLFCWGSTIVPFVDTGMSGVPLVIGVASYVIGATGTRYFLSADGLLRRWTTPTGEPTLQAGIDRVLALELTGVTMSIRGDGGVWMWDASLFNPTPEYWILSPTALTGFADVARLSGAGWWLIAGVRANGRIQTWGRVGNGHQLGTSDPAASTWFGATDPDKFAHILEVELIDSATAVAVMTSGGCAVIADGRVRCWGQPFTDTGYDKVGTYVPWEIPYLP
ncbi:MAG: hypothetical protein R3F39_05355, partial [Myxococcota bacterium]